MFEVLLGQSYFFGFYFFFELIDLMIDDFVSPFYFSNLIFSLGQFLRVTISGRSHRFIELLLLFESAFCLDVFLLIFADQVAFEFYLFKRLLVLWVCQGSLLPVHFFQLLDLNYSLLKTIDSLVALHDLVLWCLDLFFFLRELIVVIFEVSLQGSELAN